MPGYLLARIFGLLLTAATAGAGAATVTVQLTGIGSAIPYNGVYAGYYAAKVDGVDTLVFCDDFTTWVSLGQSWVAEQYDFSDVQGGAVTKFTGPVRYSQTGWLYGQVAAATVSDRARIQAAVWNIMSPGSIAMDALAQSYYNQATSGLYDSYDWSAVMAVLTPNPHGAGQEFLIPVPAVVPVPASLLLFGTGLAGLAALTRRRTASGSTVSGSRG